MWNEQNLPIRDIRHYRRSISTQYYTRIGRGESLSVLVTTIMLKDTAEICERPFLKLRGWFKPQLTGRMPAGSTGEAQMDNKTLVKPWRSGESSSNFQHQEWNCEKTWSGCFPRSSDSRTTAKFGAQDEWGRDFVIGYAWNVGRMEHGICGFAMLGV